MLDVVKFSKYGMWHHPDLSYEGTFTETDCGESTDIEHEYRYVPEGWPLSGRKCRECFPKEAPDGKMPCD